jgi:hypothetical protein
MAAATRKTAAADPAREALKSIARALARAAAIEDYNRQNGGEGYHEGGDLRAIQFGQANR